MSKPELVVFDINHTLIEDNSWLNMNLALGMTNAEDEVLWGLNQEGILPNSLWVEIVNNLYRKRGKASRQNIEKAVLNYTYLPGAKEVISNLKEKGYTIALISGGMDMLVEHVAQDLSIDLFGFGSFLFFDEQDYLKQMTYIAEDTEVKKMLLLSFCRRLGIEPEEVICIGDGDNEAELFKLSKGITFKGSKLESEAWRVVNGLDEIVAAIESNKY